MLRDRDAHDRLLRSEDGARLGELFGLPAERTVVVPNGVDPAVVPVRRRGGARAAPPHARARRRAARALPRLLARAEPRRRARRARRRRGAARGALPGRRQRRARVRRRAGARRTSTSAASSTPASCAACSASPRGAQPDALGLGDEPEDARLRARGRADPLDARSARAGSGSRPGVHYEAVEAEELAAGLEALRALPVDGSPSARAPPPSGCASASRGTRSRRAGTRTRRLRELLEGAAVA